MSDRFSAGLQAAEALEPAVAQALDELSRLGARRALRWNDEHVVVPLDLNISLPSRGPVAPILEREPVLIVLHRREYPLRAPMVLSDRRDFPRLPHLNPTTAGAPAVFCLHRGDFDAWFAEHTIGDLVERVQAWLCDAAGGNLQRDDDLWEPTITGREVGAAIFDHEVLTAGVLEEQARRPEDPGHRFMAILASDCSVSADARQFLAAVVLPRVPLADRPAPQQSSKEVQDSLGILVWPAQDQRTTEHFGVLPRTYGELLDLTARTGAVLETAVKEVENIGTYSMVLVVVAVVRPRRIVNTASEVELLSFMLTPTGELKHDTAVHVLDHYKPFTRQLATELSRHSREQLKIAVIGCGALGSKISLHLARGGESDQLLVDADALLPHNLVRHALLAGRTGKNKAEAMRDEIAALYRFDLSVKKATARADRLSTVLRASEALADRDLVIDATASQAGINGLALECRAKRVVRCEIASFGRLGIFMVEGLSRSPRIDDLQAHLYQQATKNQALSEWMRSSRDIQRHITGEAMDGIVLGQSCSSDTLRIADELVSLHAAQCAMAIGALRDGGRIIFTEVDPDSIAVKVTKVAVPPYREVECNVQGWTTRIGSGALRRIQELRKSRAPREVGGLLLGYIHLKRRIVYVTECLNPSPDSQGTPTRFLRGTHGYAEREQKVREQTGGVLGYVGEWHTHPSGLPEPSSIDRRAGEDLQKALGPHMPGHLLIDSPLGTKSHLYGV